MIISEKELDRILSKEKKVDYWLAELGRETYKQKPKQGIKAAYNFTLIGKHKYQRMQEKMYLLFCSNSKPKKNLEFLIDGSPRDIAQTVLTAIFFHFETTIAIATPLTALVLRDGLIYYCKNSPGNPRNKPKSKKGIRKKK